LKHDLAHAECSILVATPNAINMHYTTSTVRADESATV